MSWRHMTEWRQSSAILNPGTSRMWVVSFTPLPLYPRRKSPRYPLDRRLGGPQNQCENCGEENKFSPAEIPKASGPARSPSLYWLSYPGFWKITGIFCNFVEYNFKTIRSFICGSWNPCTSFIVGLSKFYFKFQYKLIRTVTVYSLLMWYSTKTLFPSVDHSFRSTRIVYKIIPETDASLKCLLLTNLAQDMTLLICVSEEPGHQVSLDFSWFRSVTPSRYRDSASN
jgi:hypothetical protein